jgi:hypothetical protein
VSQTTTSKPTSSNRNIDWLQWVLWGAAAVMTALMIYLLVQRLPGGSVTASPASAPDAMQTYKGDVALPAYVPGKGVFALARPAEVHTIIPTRGRESVVDYTIEQGDSIFGIAHAFNIEPESLLWSNYDVLRDDPHMIEVGLTLKIPPTDGILYEWQEGDTVESVAGKFKVYPDAILAYPGNKLDMTNPVIESGTYVMVPGGFREFQQWVVPTFARGAAGVSTTILGPGGCTVSGGGAYGTGTFIWPTATTVLSGNDYWSGHLAIDIAAFTGDLVSATDSGVVIYAGPVSGGYGNMVMIDHGNGYQSLYAHLSNWTVSCGQSVYQGSLIGYAGSTGNSTGPHLHFEIRYMGGFINPWQVLP